MIDFLSFVNSPLVKLINSQASNNNKNEETGNNLTTAIGVALILLTFNFF